MMKRQATKLAKNAIKQADAEGYPVADTTVVFKTIEDGKAVFHVCDNGQEDDTTSEQTAIAWIVENLTK